MTKRSIKVFDVPMTAGELQEHVRFMAAELGLAQEAHNKLMARVVLLERFKESMRDSIPYGL